MTGLELLAPARNAEIGIAAIDCGADAVYIAGPAFGARKDAGNPVSDIALLCSHAHKFGAKVFVTFNISINEDEVERMHAQMLECQEAGADAFIIREPVTATWNDIRVPLHASTQCAIRTVGDARRYEELGCSRIILERELSLKDVREICNAVNCEVEFFVHGALCVCYSGQCRLSERIDGRSADRGECIQACRSLYDLVDADGHTLVKNKALLSLKDFNLRSRLEELADAGVMSFKIEGRLKNESYVKNVVRSYSLALDELVRKYPERYRRASFGTVHAPFIPDLSKTFNRGYTELFIDGKRGRWASMDAPKSMGEEVGTVASVRSTGSGSMEISLVPAGRKVELRNGDGFAFVTKNAIEGFRGDVCEGRRILCRKVSGIHKGTRLYRNISTAFEKELEKKCSRELRIDFDIRVHGRFVIDIEAVCEDGRKAFSTFNADVETAENRDRAEALLREGLGKRVEHYSCRVASFSADGPLPLLSASTVNTMRRAAVSDIASIPVPCGRKSASKTSADASSLPTLRLGPSHSCGHGRPQFSEACPSVPLTGTGMEAEPLMRSRYCIRYELGMCPKYQGAKPSGPLFLMNNGRRLALHFNCSECEMTVTEN